MAMIKYYRPQLAYQTFNKAWDKKIEEAASKEQRNYFTPQVDIVESENRFLVTLAVPGIKKEDIKIELTDDKLNVSGERKKLESDVSLTYHKLQTAFGKFHQVFSLPDNVNRDSIQARHEDGILHITIEKLEKKENKSVIEVK